jgi:hypothetical protein
MTKALTNFGTKNSTASNPTTASTATIHNTSIGTSTVPNITNLPLQQQQQQQ